MIIKPKESLAEGRTLIFTATYNERDNVRELCNTILDLDPAFDLLVVDDSSPDGTGHALEELCAEQPRLAAVHRPGKLGLGSAHKLAMVHAIKNGYHRLVTLDADFSHDPNDIPRLLDELEGRDFVTGSRYMKGGQCEYSGYRYWVSSAANWFSRRLLGIRLHEFTTSLRAFRVSMLEELDLSTIESDGYSFFLESVYTISAAGYECSEIPIRFHDRKHGESKIPRFEIFNGMRQLMSLVGRRLTRSGATKKKPEYSEVCDTCHSRYVLELGMVTATAVHYSCLKCGHSFQRATLGGPIGDVPLEALPEPPVAEPTRKGSPQRARRGKPAKTQRSSSPPKKETDV